MVLFRYLLLCTSLALLSESSHAQSDQATQKWPVRVSFMDESLDLIGPNLFSFPLNPAFSLGTEYELWVSKRAAKAVQPKGKFLLIGEIGGYHHQYARTAAFLTVDFGYRYTFNRLALTASLGPGYTHSFVPDRAFRYQNGTYEEIKDYGSPGWMMSVGFSVSYKLGREVTSPHAHVLIRQSFEDPSTNIPLPHAFIGGGVTFFPFHKKRSAGTSSAQ